MFDKKANGADRERRVEGESKPDKGEGGQVNVLEGQVDVAKGDTPPQLDVAKGDGTPLILLWNNYQGDKSALYNKIFHR